MFVVHLLGKGHLWVRTQACPANGLDKGNLFGKEPCTRRMHGTPCAEALVTALTAYCALSWIVKSCRFANGAQGPGMHSSTRLQLSPHADYELNQHRTKVLRRLPQMLPSLPDTVAE